MNSVKPLSETLEQKYARVLNLSAEQALEITRLDYEVERLKKELAATHKEKGCNRHFQEGFAAGARKGEAEGERRAKQQFKDALVEVRSYFEADMLAGDSDVAVGAYVAIGRLLKQLGLSEEEKK